MKKYVFFGSFLIAGIGIGLFVSRLVFTDASARFSETRESGWRFVSPLLECEPGESARRGLIPFDSNIQDLVQKKIESGKLEDGAVYYRDLQNGPWFGVDENSLFIPASLLKLPLVMAYHLDAEKKPSLLDKKLLLEKKFPGPPNTVQTIAPREEIAAGEEYAVGELIERSIVYSDNQAASLLLHHANRDTLNGLFGRLGVRNAFLETQGRFDISVKEYATFLRILYNASYLNKEMSEKTLELLSRAEFTDGIVAGVPAGTVIAHKFGEAGALDGVRQIHDCGIVYHPARPYLLCIMTRGENLNDILASIKDISELVYMSVDAQLRK